MEWLTDRSVLWTTVPAFAVKPHLRLVSSEVPPQLTFGVQNFEAL
jgi:hypothetical protein